MIESAIRIQKIQRWEEAGDVEAMKLSKFERDVFSRVGMKDESSILTF